MNENIKRIGEIDFHDIKVVVYFAFQDSKDNVVAAWQMRNPDSCYQGIMYMNNETGKISYPKDAIIPEQADKDREMLPKFIVTGRDVLTDSLIKTLTEYLERDYLKRNKK